MTFYSLKKALSASIKKTAFPTISPFKAKSRQKFQFFSIFQLFYLQCIRFDAKCNIKAVFFFSGTYQLKPSKDVLTAHH